MTSATEIERWGTFELTLDGPQEGNPFVDVSFGAEFAFRHRVVPVDGFYDGNGHYKVRFMPDTLGTWRYTTTSNLAALNGQTGAFECVAPSLENHGPVRVADTYHLAYEDGTRYYQIGTTCYVWNHQGDALEEQTLATLAGSPFNKLRMCVFPKDYLYNRNEPEFFAFQGDLARGFDFTRFDPVFFHHLEGRILDLMRLGIQADLILFHPYDRWGFATMPTESDDFYLRYVVARLAAFRNVWWSMANEYDLMQAKTMADWDRFFRIVQESDPYGHLRGVHNCHGFYDHAKPWVTHQSIQHRLPERTTEWRELYKKPVIIDETQYEGNVPRQWGNIPPQEMVRKFWEGTVRGGYVGHGETYLDPDDILWWSKGGVLHGQSPERIAFLKGILEGGPQRGFDPIEGVVETRFPCAGKGEAYLLTYCGILQPALMPLNLPEGNRYEIDVLDTWDMTVITLAGRYEGSVEIELPGKPYIAVRMRAV
ncbi:MAG: DUF5060 domain-containing protein [Anaerolineae bacterium]|nr:DUF5060 domain-containing protein [Anaerolineae bacterium]